RSVWRDSGRGGSRRPVPAPRGLGRRGQARPRSRRRLLTELGGDPARRDVAGGDRLERRGFAEAALDGVLAARLERAARGKAREVRGLALDGQELGAPWLV